MKDGTVSTEAFLPDKNTAEKRGDRGAETSVNWEDHKGVLAETLMHSTAPYGAARFRVADAKAVKCHHDQQPLLCERDPITGNDHHGNIVFKSGLPGFLQKQLAAAVAMQSKFIAMEEE